MKTVPTDRKVIYAIKPRQTFRRLMAHMATLLEFDLGNSVFYFECDELEERQNPEDVGISCGDLIEVVNVM